MGNAQANETNQTMAAYTNIVNSTATSVYNQASQSCASGNNFTLNTGEGCYFESINGTFNVTQTAGTKCTFSSSDIASLNANFSNQLQNNTQQFIQQNSQSKQGWFATAFSFQVNGASNTTEVMSQMSNVFTQNFTNLCSSVANALNNATVNLCGIYDNTTFNFNQNAMVTSITSCVNDIVINVWTSNSVLNQLYQMTDQKLASQQSGFGSFLVWIAVIIGAVIVLGIIIAIIFAVIKGRQKNQAQTESQAQAQAQALAKSFYKPAQGPQLPLQTPSQKV